MMCMPANERPKDLGPKRKRSQAENDSKQQNQAELNDELRSKQTTSPHSSSKPLALDRKAPNLDVEIKDRKGYNIEIKDRKALNTWIEIMHRKGCNIEIKDRKAHNINIESMHRKGV